MTEQKPLWEVIDQAFWGTPMKIEDRFAWANVLRAIANWVVPDRLQPSTLELCYDEDDEREWHYEQRIRARLFRAADEAEGEV